MSILLLNANALTIPLASQSVHCVVTSPPYFSLRDYGVPGQIGLERDVNEYVANMVLVFREVWRVLRDDGVLWLNLGDSYNSSGGAGGDYNAGGLKDGQPRYPGHDVAGLKPKDLIGIPWRVAFALQADGWYLRSDIIWAKPNPMPESVTDRPTKAHEYVFLLAKQKRYFYDADAIREENSSPEQLEHNLKYAKSYDVYDRRANWSGQPGNVNNVGIHARPGNIGRNRRTVWTIATAPYSGAHFATYPPALVEPCIKAGTSERGCCPACGKAWERVTDHEARPANEERIAALMAKGVRSRQSANLYTQHKPNTYNTLGFRPACSCPPADPVPCIVFDPFAGSGTTLLVARSLGRHGVGTDLSYAYLHDQARSRLELDRLEAWESGKRAAAPADLGSLFAGVQGE